MRKLVCLAVAASAAAIAFATPAQACAVRPGDPAGDLGRCVERVKDLLP